MESHVHDIHNMAWRESTIRAVYVELRAPVEEYGVKTANVNFELVNKNQYIRQIYSNTTFPSTPRNHTDVVNNTLLHYCPTIFRKIPSANDPRLQVGNRVHTRTNCLPLTVSVRDRMENFGRPNSSTE